MQKEKQGNGNGNGKFTMTRRDFLKTSAAAGAGGGLLSMTQAFDNALAVPSTGGAAVAKSVPTTCACCSVGCGQLVDVDASGNILDLRGDPNHVTNRGGLCAKGASQIQIANGDRRLGVSGQTLSAFDGAAAGPAYRVGNGPWTSLSWAEAISGVATRLKAARDEHVLLKGGTAGVGWSLANYQAGQQSKTIAFLGCSHATNEENWLYRKLIANLGSNNTEHQARI